MNLYKLYKVIEKRKGFFCFEFVHSVQGSNIVDAENAFRSSGCMERHVEYFILLIG